MITASSRADINAVEGKNAIKVKATERRTERGKMN
jgi:hypothetical protein